MPSRVRFLRGPTILFSCMLGKPWTVSGILVLHPVAVASMLLLLAHSKAKSLFSLLYHPPFYSPPLPSPFFSSCHHHPCPEQQEVGGRANDFGDCSQGPRQEEMALGMRVGCWGETSPTPGHARFLGGTKPKIFQETLLDFYPGSFLAILVLVICWAPGLDLEPPSTPTPTPTPATGGLGP